MRIRVPFSSTVPTDCHWEIERLRDASDSAFTATAASASLPAALLLPAFPFPSPRMREINETNCIRMGIDWERDGAMPARARERQRASVIFLTHPHTDTHTHTSTERGQGRSVTVMYCKKCARKSFIALPSLTNDKFEMKGEPNVFRFDSFRTLRRRQRRQRRRQRSSSGRKSICVSMCVYLYLRLCKTRIRIRIRIRVTNVCCVSHYERTHTHSKRGVVYDWWLCGCVCVCATPKNTMTNVIKRHTQSTPRTCCSLALSPALSRTFVLFIFSIQFKSSLSLARSFSLHRITFYISFAFQFHFVSALPLSLALWPGMRPSCSHAQVGCNQ